MPLEGLLDLFLIGIQQGLILALVACGILIPFRILNLPDLTPEGSFPIGGALCAALLSAGAPASLAVLLAALAGGAVGVGTAAVHLRLRVNTLLAGIIISTMIYSVNLRLMGKPNLALFDFSNLFSPFGDAIPLKILFLGAVNLLIIILLYRFLLSENGLRMRAVGFNKEVSEKQGINPNTYTILGLFLGNALVALAGSLMVQQQQYADVGMGTGIVIHALAALMIGESLLGSHNLLRQLFAPFAGALIYQQIQGTVLLLGLTPSDFKLVTGAIVLATIAYKQTLQRSAFA